MTDLGPTRVPVRRRWFQFSLRSLLLLTTVCAIACAWWLRPVPQQIPLAGGALVRLETKRSSGGRSDSPPFVQWQLNTAEGQRLASGGAREDVPHGKHVCYHADGRRALEGACSRGKPIGIWHSWSPDGKLRSEWEQEGTGNREASDSMVRLWWPGGSLRAEGRLRHGGEHGVWSCYSQEGEIIASGPLVKGRRHGWWTITDPSTDARRRLYYAHGRPLPDIQTLLERLSAELRSAHRADRISAVRSLQRLGPAGAAALIKCLGQADDSTAVLILHALGEMGDDAALTLPEIRRRITAGSAPVRLQAQLAAFSIDADNRVRDREALLLAIGQSTPSAALNAMQQMFAIDTGSHPALAQQLIFLLGRKEGRELLLVELGVRPFEVIPLLLAALDDPDAMVRRQIVELMIAYRNEAGQTWHGADYRGTLGGLLEKASRDPDPAIRAAVETLRAGPPGGGGYGGSGGMF